MDVRHEVSGKKSSALFMTTIPTKPVNLWNDASFVALPTPPPLHFPNFRDR